MERGETDTSDKEVVIIHEKIRTKKLQAFKILTFMTLCIHGSLIQIKYVTEPVLICLRTRLRLMAPEITWSKFRFTFASFKKHIGYVGESGCDGNGLNKVVIT